LVGAWRVTVLEYPENWPKRERQAEWHVRCVVEGRAIEDVFIVPPRAQRTPDTPREGNRYGASLCVYDTKRDECHITPSLHRGPTYD